MGARFQPRLWYGRNGATGAHGCVNNPAYVARIVRRSHPTNIATSTTSAVATVPRTITISAASIIVRRR
jgi:hypothetical protein